ncbi:MAG: D-alanine--D-alanine ligase [Calditrichaeota bacterium]|nr:D-alanine--D-alanine ligase [Calditrichota bacterium]HQU70742.1 D-alanine--D-alanine ligase [Calditrichia bacterium]
MKVAVLLGGTSAERDVSFQSGLAAARALQTLGHQVVILDCAYGDLAVDLAGATGGVKVLPPDIEKQRDQLDRNILKTVDFLLREKIEVVYNALHGGYGENGYLQALLDLAGIPYTGSGPSASLVGMDKHLSKLVFRENEVAVAPWRKYVFPAIPHQAVADELGLPLVIKPNRQGSTVGLTIVRDAGDLRDAAERAFEFDHTLLVEAFIPGRELTVAVLDDKALPVIEIIPESGFYDYESKYQSGKTRYEVPADIPEAVAKALQKSALTAFHALGCFGYARMDYRMNADYEFFCLEANTLPGMTATSLVPKAAAAAGISFEQLVARILEMALERSGRNG